MPRNPPLRWAEPRDVPVVGVTRATEPNECMGCPCWCDCAGVRQGGSGFTLDLSGFAAYGAGLQPDPNRTQCPGGTPSLTIEAIVAAVGPRVHLPAQPHARRTPTARDGNFTVADERAAFDVFAPYPDLSPYASAPIAARGFNGAVGTATPVIAGQGDYTRARRGDLPNAYCRATRQCMAIKTIYFGPRQYAYSYEELWSPYRTPDSYLFLNPWVEWRPLEGDVVGGFSAAIFRGSRANVELGSDFGRDVQFSLTGPSGALESRFGLPAVATCAEPWWFLSLYYNAYRICRLPGNCGADPAGAVAWLTSIFPASGWRAVGGKARYDLAAGAPVNSDREFGAYESNRNLIPVTAGQTVEQYVTPPGGSTYLKSSMTAGAVTVTQGHPDGPDPRDTPARDRTWFCAGVRGDPSSAETLTDPYSAVPPKTVWRAYPSRALCDAGCEEHLGYTLYYDTLSILAAYGGRGPLPRQNGLDATANLVGAIRVPGTGVYATYSAAQAASLQLTPQGHYRPIVRKDGTGSPTFLILHPGFSPNFNGADYVGVGPPCASADLPARASWKWYCLARPASLPPVSGDAGYYGWSCRLQWAKDPAGAFPDGYEVESGPHDSYAACLLAAKPCPDQIEFQTVPFERAPDCQPYYGRQSLSAGEAAMASPPVTSEPGGDEWNG